MLALISKAQTPQVSDNDAYIFRLNVYIGVVFIAIIYRIGCMYTLVWSKATSQSLAQWMRISLSSATLSSSTFYVNSQSIHTAIWSRIAFIKTTGNTDWFIDLRMHRCSSAGNTISAAIRRQGGRINVDAALRVNGRASTTDLVGPTRRSCELHGRRTAVGIGETLSTFLTEIL